MVGQELDFQQLFTEYQPRIRRYLTELVGEFEAEDLTQEVFIRVNRSLSGFRGESRPSAWIYRIATNAAYDRLRQSSYHKEAVQPLTEDFDTTGQKVVQDAWTSEPAPSIEHNIHRKQRYECFCDVLNRLPENYRLIMALNQLEDFTVKEIADILGLNMDLVKIRLHRGRVRLLKDLKAHCKPEDWL